MADIPDLLQTNEQRAEQQRAATPAPAAESPSMMLQVDADARRQQGFASSLETVSKIDPTKFARALQVERTSGVPADVLARNSEHMERLLRDNRYAQLSQQYKRTAEALQDGRTAAVAQRDIENLARIERAAMETRFNEQSAGEKLLNVFEQSARSLRRGFNAATADDLNARRQEYEAYDRLLANAAEVGREVTIDEVNRIGGNAVALHQQNPEAQAAIRSSVALERTADLVGSVAADSKALGALPKDIGAVRADELGGDLAGTAEALLENPGYAARTALGGIVTSLPMLLGAAAGGLPVAAVLGFGTEYSNKLVDVLGEAGIDLEDPKAVMAALQDDALMNSARERAALKAAGTTAVDMVGLKIAGSLVIPKTVGGRALAPGAREWANLGLQVPIQGVLEGAGEAAGQYLADGKVDAGDVLLEAVAGAGMSVAEVGAMSGGRMWKNMNRGLEASRKAREGARSLSEMVGAALESETRQLDRETFSTVAGKQLADSPMEMLSIPIEALQQLNQSGADLTAILAAIPGLTEQFAEAEARGGSVSLKTSDYLAHLAEHHEQLSGFVRVGIDGMSAEDAVQWQADQEAEITAFAEAMRAPVDERSEAYTSLLGELMQTGYRRADAEQYAATHMAAMSTLADRAGKPLAELMARFPLSIGTQAPEAVARITVDDARLLVQRLRAGDVPTEAQINGPSLLEFVRKNGGLLDDGGELAAIDIDQGSVGGNRIVRADGRSPDDMIVSAWENGYFPGAEQSELTPDMLVQSLRDELGGIPRYSAAQENTTRAEQAQQLNQLQDYLDRLGVDLDEVSDDDVLAMLRGQDQAPGQQLNQFAGTGALTADATALASAQDRLAKGEDAESVRKETGWFTGADGKWRFEIADGEARVLPRLDAMKHAGRHGEQITAINYKESGGLWVVEVYTEGMQVAADKIELVTTDVSSLAPVLGDELTARLEARDGEQNILSDDPLEMVIEDPGSSFRSFGGASATIGEILDHPRLFQAYPQLAGMKVVYAPQILGGAHGAMSINARTGEPVMVLGDGSSDEVRKTILHELQHGIQAIEGFARGGSVERAREDQAYVEGIAQEDLAFRMDQWRQQYPQAAALRDEIDVVRGQLADQFGDPFSDEAMASDLFGQFEALQEQSFEVPGYDDAPVDAVSDLMPLELYNRLAGEVEARTVENRSHMTERVARMIPPTPDVADSDVIVSWGGEDMRSEALAQRTLNQGAVKDASQIKGLDDELQALASELIESGAVITPDGKVALYHRTTPEGAAAIRESGEMTGAEDGLFFSTRRDGGQASEFGNSVVAFQIPLEELQLDDAFPGEAHVRVPLEFAGERLDVSAWIESPERTLSQSDNQGPRGFITFSEGAGRSFQISLTERRDLSTLLHEFGHYYLEVLNDLAQDADAPAQIKADVAAIREWTGAGESGAFGVEQHEQFARGFEAYLAEGKAPSEELRGAFARFKRWIIAVYKDLVRLDVTLTDEIRGVMDRIVATDAQIQEAQQVSNALPLFESAARAGMIDAEFAQYQATVELARAEAVEDVERQVMAEEERRRGKWWREETERVRREVDEELDTVQEYAAIKALRSGVMPDGSSTQLKLSSGEIQDRYGLGVLRKLAFMHSKSRGAPMDAVGQALGYPTGDDLVKGILSAPPRSEALKAEVDRRMLERHGPKASGEIAERAMDAVHNEKRAAVLIKELNALAKQGSRRNVTTQQVMKVAAQRIMHERKVRDVQPFEYQRAEAKNGRLAFEAAAKGDIEAAYGYKQSQLMNFYLWREAHKAQQAVGAITERMGKFNKTSVRQKLGKAGHDYLDQIDAIMEQYRFRDVSLRQVDRQTSFAEWYTKQVEEGADPFVPEFVLRNAGRVSYKDLTYAQLTELDDFAANIKHLAGMKNKLLANKRVADLKDAQNLLSAAAFDNMDKLPTRHLVANARSLPEVAMEWLRKGNSSLLKMEQVIEWLDGGDSNGAWSTLLFQPLAEAQHRRDNMNREVTQRVVELTSQWMAERGSSVGEIFSVPGLATPMTTNGMLAVALNSGNQSNLDKLVRGYGWDKSMVPAILSRMTEADWRYVKSMWDTVESLWPEIAALEKQVNGVVPPKIEGLTISTQWGEFKGGYWPLVYDPLSQQFADVEKGLGALSPMAETGTVRATPPRGHTQARVDGFAAPILLDVSVIAQHLNQVIHDITHRVALADAHRLLKGEVREAMNQTIGPEMAAQFINILDGIASDQVTGSAKSVGTFSKVMNTLRTNQAVAWMGYSVTTVLNQFGGYAQALDYFAQKGGRKHFYRALIKFSGSPIDSQRMVKEMSGEMRNRAVNLDASIREAQQTVLRMKDGRIVQDAFKGMANGRDVMVKYAYVPMQVAQSVVDTAVWMAAYEMEGGTLSHEQAVAGADRAVRLTQTAGGAKDMATIQQNLLAKMFMPVYGYASLLWNRNVDIARSAKQAVKARSATDVLVAFERFVYLNLLPAILSGAVKGAIPGDDDEESFAGWLAIEALKGVAAGIPLVGAATSGFFDKFGYSGASTIGQVFDSAIRAGNASEAQSITTNAISAVGAFTGLPSSQINRAVKTGFMVENGEMEAAADSIMRGLLFGPQVNK